MSQDTYKTIEAPAEGLYKDKGSKFLAFGYPVSSLEEISEILESIRKKYHDARHRCYAYRIGIKNEVSRMNDDGEPANTAGKPIHGQILANGLTNILIVVVRYFGGTLLGRGGLVKAYKAAATDMLSNARIAVRLPERFYKIEFEYNALNEVLKVLDREHLKQEDNKFDSLCSVIIRVNANIEKSILPRLERIRSVKVSALDDNMMQPKKL
jgi:uncharacterized YigZ family protein